MAFPKSAEQSTESKSFIVYHILAAIVIGFACLARFQYIFVERLWSDEALYAWLAKRIYSDPKIIFSSEAFSSFHPPLFPSILAIFHNFFPPETACRLVVFIFYLGGIWAIYSLGNKIKNRTVGLFCALGLAFQTNYFFYSTMILIDVPLMVISCWFMFMLVVYQKTEKPKHAIILTFLGIVIILLKSSGVAILFFMAIYFLFHDRHSGIIKNCRKFMAPFLSILFVWFLLRQLYHVLNIEPPQLAVGRIIKPRKEWLLYMGTIVELLKSPNIIVFFLYGLFMVLFRESWPRKFLLLIWFLLYFVAMSYSPEYDLRYNLLLFPPMLLIAGIGFESMLTAFKKWQVFLKLIFIILVAISLLNTKGLIDHFARIAVGYKIAGEVVKEIVQPDALVIASSERQIRYYSDINYEEFGGQMVVFRQEKKDFEEILKNNQNVVLVVDRWEELQPLWSKPFTLDTLNYLQSLKFQLISVVYKTIETSKGKSSREPVVWILQRTKI